MPHHLTMAPRPELKPPVGADDHAIGPSDAIVQLVMFGDYQCPHCKAADAAVRRLRDEENVSLRLIWRHFPLAKVHPLARDAAIAAEVAARAGLFWPMHDLLFTQSPKLERENLMEYAKRIGMDKDAFLLSLSDPQLAARVQEHIKSGVRSGVNKTPTLYLQGLRYNGSNDAALLRAAISAAADLAVNPAEATPSPGMAGPADQPQPNGESSA